jgi:hypothetical protein
VRNYFGLALLGLWCDFGVIEISQMIFRLLVIGIQGNFHFPPQKQWGRRKEKNYKRFPSFVC